MDIFRFVSLTQKGAGAAAAARAAAGAAAAGATVATVGAGGSFVLGSVISFILVNVIFKQLWKNAPGKI